MALVGGLFQLLQETNKGMDTLSRAGVVCDGLKGGGHWFMVWEWIGEASGGGSGHGACGSLT